MELAELRGLTTLLLSHPRRLQDELRRRPTLMLFSANVAAQSISVALSPVLSRLYSPEDFGVLGGLSALVMIALPLASLRYEYALPRARSDREALALLSLCALVISGMSALVGIATFFATQPSGIAWLEPLRPFLYFLPIAAFATAAFDTLAIEASRRGQLAPLASSKLTQSLFGVGGQLALGLLHTGAFGLLLGFVINQAAGVTRLFRQLVVGHPGGRAPAWSEVRQVAVAHRDFPLYTSWSSALESCSRWALQLAITVLWDPRIGGFIFLADRVIGRPLLMLSTALLPVFISQFGRAVQEAPARAAGIFFATLRRQALVSVSWTLGVLVLAPLTFGPLFGPAWGDAVGYVQVMSLAIAPATTLHPVGVTLQLVGRQRSESQIVMVKVALIAIGLVVCYWQHASAMLTLGVFAVLQLLVSLVRFGVYARVVRAISAAH